MLMKSEADGSVDCLVTEMLQELPMKSVDEITHWFGVRFIIQRRMLSPSSVANSTFKKLDAKLEKGDSGVRALALMSVLAKRHAAVVGRLLQEAEPIEWKELHIGAERSVNCDHM